MKVFISWSNPRSKAIAEALRDWLPVVIQAIDPWLSSQDIAAGSRWGNDIQQQLDECKAGILCMVPDNTDSPWIHYEAGALSKAVAKRAMVIPYLDGLETSDLKPPLSQFNMCAADSEGTLKMLMDLNAATPKPLSENGLARIFGKFWPDLELRIKEAPSAGEVRRRSDHELLVEILSNSRTSNSAISRLTTYIELNSFGTSLYGSLPLPQKVNIASLMKPQMHAGGDSYEGITNDDYSDSPDPADRENE